MPVYCWPTVVDGGSTFNRNWFCVLCLPGAALLHVKATPSNKYHHVQLVLDPCRVELPLIFHPRAAVMHRIWPLWLKLPAWRVGDRGFKPHSGLQVSKKQNNVSSPLIRKKIILWGTSVTERYVLKSCVWKAVSSYSSHHPQEVLLAQFSLYVHKGGLNPQLFHFICLTLSR